MQFSKIFAGLALASTGLAALSAQQIADGFNLITKKSQALQAPAQSITILNAPLIVIGAGPFPVLIAGFTDIATTAGTLVAQFPGTKPIAKREEPVHARDLSIRGVDADIVFNAVRAFVRVHQQLLNILIGKAGVITSVPVVGRPVAVVLRSIEAVVDTIAYTLIDLVEARAKDLTAEFGSLSATLTITIEKYDNLQV